MRPRALEGGAGSRKPLTIQHVATRAKCPKQRGIRARVVHYSTYGTAQFTVEGVLLILSVR